MQPFLAALLVLAAPADVEVRTLDGQSAEGPIVEFNGNRLTVETADGLLSWDTDDLLGVFPKGVRASQDKAAVLRIVLYDGSTLAARQYLVDGTKAQITLSGDRTIELRSADVAGVRFKQGSTATADEWSRITSMKTDSDLLVVGDENSIDYHKGVLHDVTESVAQFELDGTMMRVRRSKVYGLVYHGVRHAEAPSAVCRITDAAGSQWAARSIELSVASDPPGELRWTTPAGVERGAPLTMIRQLDFSQGKVVFLGDLKPESTTFTPYFGSRESLPLLASFYAMRADRNLESDPLSLGGKQYAKGLALHSRTEAVYRLPGRFRRFKAIAGIDDGVRPHGNVRLVIFGDDRILFKATLSGADPPVPVDLNVTEVRRLTILAEFGDKADVGDHLDLCEARIIK